MLLKAASLAQTLLVDGPYIMPQLVNDFKFWYFGDTVSGASTHHISTILILTILSALALILPDFTATKVNKPKEDTWHESGI